MNTISSVTLNNGIMMPVFGLGVWQITDENVVSEAVITAVEKGYRSIDTAAIYKNETGVGKGIRECGIPRKELFITTKVWNGDQGYDSTLKAFDESRKKLGLEYIDLYLIHWPVKGKYIDTWKALEKLYKEKYVRAIGVSNFNRHHLEDILDRFNIIPAVNQIELHPMLTQKELFGYCKSVGIQVEAWSPLMQGQLNHPVLMALSEKYHRTPAQIVLRWDIQSGVVTIPKSSNKQRIEENIKVFDFELEQSDMEKIDAINIDRRLGPDPDNFNF